MSKSILQKAKPIGDDRLANHLKSKNQSLSSKIAKITALALTIIFIFLIMIIGINVKTSMKAVLVDEFNEISLSNAQQIENIIISSETTVKSLQNYLNDSYEKEASLTAVDSAKIHNSDIFKTPISELNYQVELFMTGVTKNTILNNPDIFGMGVFFEPYSYDSRIKDYNFYMNSTLASNNSYETSTYEEVCDKEYYSVAAKSQQRYITAPYQEQGITMVSISYPIVYNGKTQGVIVTDINVTNFKKIYSANSKYPSMNVSIFDKDGTFVYDSENPDNITKSITDFGVTSDDLVTIKHGMKGTKSFQVVTTRTNGDKYTCFYVPISAGEDTWWSQTVVKNNEMNAAVAKSVILLISLCVITLLLIILIITRVLKKMLNPINDIVNAAQSISQGGLDIKLETNSNDEIGILAETFNATGSTLKTIISDINYLLNEMANGNFDISTQSEVAYVGDFNQILISIRNINANLSNTLAHINQSSLQVDIGAQQVSTAAQALSQGAVEQASSIEELSATISEIADHVKLNAKNAQNASIQSNEAGVGISESNLQMKEMVSAMSDISDKSNEIGKIIKTIEDIAFQTNILALNAAVEAARAGAAGKGFAVVADEVRNLATKSAEAAKNTTDLIEQTVSAVMNGSKIADNTANSLLAVVEKTDKVNSLIGEIAKASEDQATSISQVTLGVEQISGVVQSNSATAEESAAASEELNTQADMLKNLVNQFKFNQDLKIEE